MAFQTSPGINVSEIDLTNATPAVGTTEGAIAGVFRWGPTNERILVTSETDLVQRFGEPSTRYNGAYTPENLWTNHETFLTAANFLGYSDALFVTRVVSDSAVKSTLAGSEIRAKYEGDLGNSLEISQCISTGFGTGAVGSSTITINSGASTAQFDGFASQSEASSLKRGDVVIVQGQELKLSADADVSGGGTAIEETFEADVVPTQLGTGDTDGGTIIHDADDTLGTSIIHVGANVSQAIAKGTPVEYDRLTSGNITGLESGRTYFAIPVTVSTKTFNHDDISNANETITISAHGYSTGDRVIYRQNANAALNNLTDGAKLWVYVVDANTIKLYTANPAPGVDAIDLTTTGSDDGYGLDEVGVETSSATNLFKLADTYAKAVAYSESNQNNVQMTAFAGAGGDNKLSFKPSAVTATASFTSRYTGIESVLNGAYTKQWGDKSIFDAAPDTNHCHIVVKDSDGKITGTAGSVIERYNNVSLIAGAKKSDGSTNFLPEVLTASSNWIELVSDSGASQINSTFSFGDMTGGSDGDDENNIALGKLSAGYDLYVDPADVDISFVLQGKARGGVALSNYIIDNIADVRRDCVAFISPAYADNMTPSSIVAGLASLTSSTFAVVDSGYKYQYDKYSDVYRWVPLNGDVAGLCARTDDLRDPWFSPAGYSRGNVKNVVKLKVNPTKAQRDLLYKNKINPVITQPGQGTVLFGDKTFAPTTSAFDRINVRRLFIVLEKTISEAAKSTLFEFNDEFTRATFVNLVEPFLRDVQGRRGIFDFKVVCDETNNDDQVIDTNQFVGDIYVKPARSINFIQLNFVAVRSGVEFSEIVGAA